MDSAWISAFSAVMGSLVGGFATFVTTYANQRSQYRRDFLSKQFAKRETLYSEFINEAARLQIDFFDRQMDNASGLVNIYALENRVRLNASEEVIQAAVHTIEKLIESPDELRPDWPLISHITLVRPIAKIVDKVRRNFGR
jgi:hypothetical protein